MEPKKHAFLAQFLLVTMATVTSGFFTAGDKFGLNCTLRSSCRLSPDMTSYHMNCGCDDTCAIYGDCCKDELINKKPFPTVLKQGAVERMTCVNDARLDRRFPVYVLQKCVDNFPDAVIRDKCENVNALEPEFMGDMFPYVPVTGLQSGILFRNSYCALCNSEKYFDIWRVNISANDPALLEAVKQDIAKSDWAAISKLKHMVEYSHPIYKAHMCKNPISKCASDWPDNDIKRACSREAANFVYRLYDTYKNIHCAVCNNIKRDDPNLTCVDGRALLHTSNPVFRGPPSFSILFDFSSGTLTREQKLAGGRWVTEEEVIDVKCEEGKVFDPFTAECRQLYCPPGYVLKDLQCISAEDGGATCSMVSFKVTEFEYLQNKSVYIFALETSYPPGEYWTDGANVLICNPNWGDTGYNITRNVTQWEDFFKNDPVQGYVTIALNIISIIGLSIQLGVYAYFPVLRNTPGKCLMCLSSALLVSQLLFTVGANQNQIIGLCKAIAIVIHYGFLAYFFWMNIMAFDIFRAFSGTKSHSLSGSDAKRKFLFYSLYAWLSPLGIVLLAMIFDFTKVQAVMPDYGKAFCWFGNQSGLLIFFVLPVACLLFADIVFFTLTVRQIHLVKESTKGITKNKGEQQRLGLYVKLAIIMGLTWILGFVASLIQSTVVWYIFVVLNSLQGLWICLTFICNSKVINLIRGRYTKYRLSTSQSDRSSKTRSTFMSESVRHSRAHKSVIKEAHPKEPGVTEGLLDKSKPEKMQPKRTHHESAI